jgi:hypothetical protein
MGVGGTGHRALGLAAVRALLLLALLGGCSAAPEIVGVVSGAIAGGGSANPAVGFGVGVGAAALTDYGLKYVGRRWHRSEQDAIAEAAGALPEGGKADWRIRHDLPLGNEHGRLQVVRVIANPLASCKQVVFSVQESDEPEAWYSADVCQQEARWKWASAEPAVERWGNLQ